MSLSVVMPAFNEANFIKNTIDTLFFFLKDEIKFEVIVINNASDDLTGLILEEDKRVKVINLIDKVTVAAARNVGYRQALYNNIAFIDADILITKQWVDALKNYIAIDKNLVTGAKVGISVVPSWIEKSWFYGMKKKSLTGYINSGNLVVKKAIVDALGGFDESLITGEDVDFSIRAKESGFDVCENPRFLVHHEGYPKTLNSFFRRELWHGAGDMKSIVNFLNSKIAIFSTATMLLLVLILVSLAISQFNLSVMLVIVWFFLHSVFLYYRFSIKNIQHFLLLLGLNNFYVCARALSFFGGVEYD